MEPFDWTCPFCNRDQAVTEDQVRIFENTLYHLKSVYGITVVEIESVRCANNKCLEIQLVVSLFQAIPSTVDYQYVKGDLIKSWPLLPESYAKPQPEYIPKQIVEDYTEACKIRDLSPQSECNSRSSMYPGNYSRFL